MKKVLVSICNVSFYVSFKAGKEFVKKVNLGHDFIVDRDLNSAVNIAKKYGALWSVHSFNKYSLLNVKEINSNELE